MDISTEDRFNYMMNKCTSVPISTAYAEDRDLKFITSGDDFIIIRRCTSNGTIEATFYPDNIVHIITTRESPRYNHRNEMNIVYFDSSDIHKIFTAANMIMPYTDRYCIMQILSCLKCHAEDLYVVSHK